MRGFSRLGLPLRTVPRVRTLSEQPKQQPPQEQPKQQPESLLHRYKEELRSYTDGLLNSTQRSALFQDLQALLDEAERRKYNTKRFFVIAGVVAVYLAYDSIKKFTANQAAAVSKEYLENPQFKRDVVAFLESPEIRSGVEQLLKASVLELCEEAEVQRQLQALFVRIMQNEDVRRQAQELATEKVAVLLRDKAVQDAAGDAAWGALRRVLGRS